MVNGLHLYSAFIQSALQFIPLIHPFTHTFTHQRRLAAMQGTNQLIRSNWGLGVPLRDTSTRPGWDRTGNPPTARSQLLSHIATSPIALISSQNTRAKGGVTGQWDRETLGVFAQIRRKHKHKDVTAEREGKTMTECQKQIVIMNNNQHETQTKTRQDRTGLITFLPPIELHCTGWSIICCIMNERLFWIFRTMIPKHSHMLLIGGCNRTQMCPMCPGIKYFTLLGQLMPFERQNEGAWWYCRTLGCWSMLYWDLTLEYSWVPR